MARTLEQVLREQVGSLVMQIAAAQVEIERLTEELTKAKDGK